MAVATDQTLFQLRLVTNNAARSHAEASLEDEPSEEATGLEMVSTAKESDVTAPRAFFARIPLFRKLLETEWRDKESIRVVLPSLGYLDSFMAILSSMERPGGLDIRPPMQFHLYSIATTLGLVNFQRACEEYIAVHLSPDTVLHALQHSLRLGR